MPVNWHIIPAMVEPAGGTLKNLGFVSFHGINTPTLADSMLPT